MCNVLATLGMQPIDMLDNCVADYYHVILDGKVLGLVKSLLAVEFTNQLRYLKAKKKENVKRKHAFQLNFNYHKL